MCRDAKTSSLASRKKTPATSWWGAGVSSVDSVVGFVELSQGNFDLFKPATFTGAGQKFRIKVSIGTERKIMKSGLLNRGFLGRKLALGVTFFYAIWALSALIYIREIVYGTTFI